MYRRYKCLAAYFLILSLGSLKIPFLPLKYKTNRPYHNLNNKMLLTIHSHYSENIV